jgi:SAM-dependent methyltransferase
VSASDAEHSSHFDEIAGVYDESLPPHVVEHYLRKRIAYVFGLGAAGSVLDVGCGTGTLARRLIAAGYRVTGVDPSEGMLEVMRARSPQIHAVRGSGTELPFDPDSFDVVVSIATFHHIAEPAAVRATLAEMTRVSRPGGRVLIWDHNPRNPYWSSLMARVPQDTGEERLIPARELVDGLLAGGAQVLRVEQLGAVPDFTPRFALGAAAALERMLERTPALQRYAAHNVVVATKSG